jgi:hypothetical protein
VSVAVGHTTGGLVARSVISKLEVWDPSGGIETRLPPGTILDLYQIRRSVAAAEDCGYVYVMEFESSGHLYHCPLVSFQSRTRAIDADANPARDAEVV